MLQLPSWLLRAFRKRARLAIQFRRPRGELEQPQRCAGRFQWPNLLAYRLRIATGRQVCRRDADTYRKLRHRGVFREQTIYSRPS